MKQLNKKINLASILITISLLIYQPLAVSEEKYLLDEKIHEALSEIHTDMDGGKNVEALTKLKKLTTTDKIKDYDAAVVYQTMAFVNAIAWIAHCENHHPDLAVGYHYCHVTYQTHAIEGLSENDFICAAKIDALLPSA